MKDRGMRAVGMIVAMVLTGCSPFSRGRDGRGLRFDIAMQVNSAQTFHASLGVHNAGKVTFQGDNAFNGQMELRQMPSREVRASGHVLSLRALGPGDTAWPLTWDGELEPGTYELSWGAEGYGVTRKRFSIVEQEGRLYLEGEAPAATPVPTTSTASEEALEPAHSTPVVDGAQTADWQLFKDEMYGFQLKVPQNWTYKDLETGGAGMPADWPLERSVSFFPQAWAELFEETDGPPEPGASPAVPVLSLEVYVGSVEQLRRALPEATSTDVVEIHGTEVVREVEALSDQVQLVRYVFQHPCDPMVWVAVHDNYGGFAVRRAENPEVTDLIQTVDSTFSFGR